MLSMASPLPHPRKHSGGHRNARKRDVGSYTIPAREVQRGVNLPRSTGTVICDACGSTRAERWIDLVDSHACSVACADRLLEAMAGIKRPRCRADCINGPRPCPWVRCRWHLYLTVSNRGALRLTFPDLEPWELAHTCMLDVIDRGELGPNAIAAALNMTRERARQLLAAASRVMARGLERFRPER